MLTYKSLVLCQIAWRGQQPIFGRHDTRTLAHNNKWVVATCECMCVHFAENGKLFTIKADAAPIWISCNGFNIHLIIVNRFLGHKRRWIMKNKGETWQNGIVQITKRRKKIHLMQMISRHTLTQTLRHKDEWDLYYDSHQI